jgi:hypothetical protein
MSSSVVQARSAQLCPGGNSLSAASEKPSRRGRLIPTVVAAICLAPFTPLLMPDDRVITDSIFCDYSSFQLPIREFAREEFLSGRFPPFAAPAGYPGPG